MFASSYEFIQYLLLWTGLFSVFLVIVGLYKPTILLWWEDTQNRIRILRVYGISAIVLLSLYLLSLVFIQSP